MTCTDCEAKASFSSNRPISSTCKPANFNALGTASTGPIPITSGATPATANERNFNIGVNPSATAFSRFINNTDAAPSLICEELPAVTDPVTENRSEEHTSELQS